MIKKEYPNQFLLGPYQLWTYNIPYAHRHQAGEIKKRLILIFDRGYSLDELEEDPTAPSHLCPYFAFFTSNKNAKSIKPNIFIGKDHLADFHLKHPSTLNIRDGFLSSKDNTITVEDIEKNGDFIAELSETAIKYLLQFSSSIEKWEKFRLMSLNEFKEHKLQDQKWIQDNVLNEQMSLKESSNSKTNIELIDNLIEDIYNLRQEGMKQEDGEYSILNLIFKEFRNLGYLDNLKELKKQEISKELSLEHLHAQILLETKHDINAFIGKFGQKTYDEFKKSSQRLKNNGYSTDIIKYTKDDNWTKEKLDKLLFNLSNKLAVSKNDSTEIEGEYIDLGVQGNYHIYEPLDAQSVVSLVQGSNRLFTGSTHKSDKISLLKSAKIIWNFHNENGERYFIYLSKYTNSAKYVIEVHPKVIDGYKEKFFKGCFIEETNFKIYNVKEEGLEPSLDYVALNKLSLSPGLNAGVNLILNGTLFIEDKVYDIKNAKLTKIGQVEGQTFLIQTKNDYIDRTSIPVSAYGTIFTDGHWKDLKKIEIPHNVKTIKNYAFSNCYTLAFMSIPNSVEEIGSYAFENCYHINAVIIPKSVKTVKSYAFNYCHNLTIYCEEESQPESWDKDWNPDNRPVVWGYKKHRENN